MTTEAERARETMDLADWRRRLADLYAEVRRVSATDVAAALALWRERRESLIREHPSSPVPIDRRATFRASHFEHDPGLRFEVRVVPAAEAPPAAAPAAGAVPAGAAPAEPPSLSAIDFGVPAAANELPVSAGGTMSFTRIGHVEIPFAEGPRRLGVFWMAGYAGGLFIPFRDATNGRETYAAGRYLVDAAKSADLGAGATDDSLILDFNFAYQPSCAFDPKWACPLAPPENRLDIPIRAGERLG
jgi:uncharacterized protein (DUF1684 family)